jgi:glutamate dehydrogenase
MAWRDDEARSALIHRAAGTIRPGSAPASFAELLFGRTTLEDLATHDAASLAALTEEAWDHVATRSPGGHDIRVFNPLLPDGRELTVVEVLNDNMPFLFDSTTAELTEQGFEAKLVAHPLLAVERDAAGRLTHFYGDALTQSVAKGERESLIHIHIDRIDSDAERKALADSLSKTLDDVRAAVLDWRAMRARTEAAIEAFKANPPPLPVDEIAEANQLLQWLCDENFTFLGVREYRFSSEDMATADVVEGSGLGILRDPEVKILRRGAELVVMTPEIREFMREPTVLIVAKANVKSRVHRRVHMDYVGVKLYSPT